MASAAPARSSSTAIRSRSCLMFAVQAEGIRDPHRRGPRRTATAASAAASLHGASRPAMRLLHAGLPDAGDGGAGARAGHQRRGSARRAVVQSLPLHRLPEHHQGGPRGRGREMRDCAGSAICDAGTMPDAKEIGRPLGHATGGPAAGHRPGPLCGRCHVPASAAHAGRALDPRAWPDPAIDRHGRCACRARRASRSGPPPMSADIPPIDFR